MRSVRAIFMAALVGALAVYALDCFAAVTPDEAMQCCDSMSCPQHGHDGSQDCCQTMSASHGPFLQSHAPDTASHAQILVGMVPGSPAAQPLRTAQALLTVNSHAPPLPSLADTPIRV